MVFKQGKRMGKDKKEKLSEEIDKTANEIIDSKKGANEEESDNMVVNIIIGAICVILLIAIVVMFMRMR